LKVNLPATNKHEKYWKNIKNLKKRMKMGDEYIQKKILKEATGTMNGLDSLFHYFKTVNTSNIFSVIV